MPCKVVGICKNKNGMVVVGGFSLTLVFWFEE